MGHASDQLLKIGVSFDVVLIRGARRIYDASMGVSTAVRRNRNI